jgi:hypothetical protein
MFQRNCVPLISGLAVVLCLTGAGVAQGQTATDIPLWYDVATTTPPNIKLNTDATFQLQNEEQLAVDPTNPDNLVAVWRDFRLGYRQCGYAYSHDGGTSWTEGGLFGATPYNRDSDPGVVASSNGMFYSIILSYDNLSDENGLVVPLSLDSGETWFGYLEGVITYDTFFEDKELMACDVTGGPSDGNLYITWTRFGDSTGIFSVTSTNGLSFGPPTPVSDVGRVQWSVPVVRNDGAVVVAWFSYAYSAIRYDISVDQGQTWGTDRTLANTTFFPSLINGGINTYPFPALASDVTDGPYDGNLYCSFADYANDGHLDLYFTKSTDGGDTWSPRIRLNDDPVDNNIDQFHPWTSVNRDGVVTVAWYDRRLDPANLSFDLYISHSFDGGETWTPNQRVSNVSSSPFDASAFKGAIPPVKPIDPNSPIALWSPQAGLIGEYIGLATSERRATLVFTDTRNGNQDVYAANMPLRLFPPHLTGPADGQITNDPAVTFTWDDYSIYETPLTYALEYSTDPTFATGVTRLDGLSVQSEEETLSDGLYYWRVRAFDTFGDSSDVTVHTVWIDTTPPDPPTPLPPSPLDGDTINDPTPTFAWGGSTAKDAATPTPLAYDLEIASDAGFSADLRTYPDLEATDFTLPTEDSLFFEQYWYWRVSAEDAAGNQSGFSTAQEFYLAVPYILGDLDDDGFITSLDLAALIDVLFQGADVPVPPDERADLNCDGFIDPLDLPIIIDHLFAGAPPPECP